MYDLLESQNLYNKQFLEKFAKENEDPADVMWTWRENEGKIKKDKVGMYSTTSISPPHSFATAMLCRMFNKPDSTKFSPEWMRLIDATINTTRMNWAQLLSDNLVKTIMEYRRNRSISSRVYPPFFMSAYVMDAICFHSKFLSWDGSGLCKTCFLSIYIIRVRGSLSFTPIFTKFVKELYCLSINKSTTEMPLVFLEKLK